MNYSSWNDIISAFIFNAKKAESNVYLYLSKKDIIELGRRALGLLNDKEIWADFINAIRYGDFEKNELSHPFSPIYRPLELFYGWQRSSKTGIPPYVAYLVLYILPLTESDNPRLNTNNYYGRVNDFFIQYGIIDLIHHSSIGTQNFKKLNELWTDLEEWSILVKNTECGIFELRKFGNPNWIYVGMPLSQCLLSTRSIRRLPEVFLKANLIPNSLYSTEDFRRIIVRFGEDLLEIKQNVAQLIKDVKNELGNSIIEIVKREYQRWNGESHFGEADDTSEGIKRNFTVAGLFLQFSINTHKDSISFSFRLFSTVEYPPDLVCGGFEIEQEHNGWSKSLNIPFKQQLEIKDEFNHWVARFPNKEVRVFVSAAAYHQLSNEYWIEANALTSSDKTYILATDTLKNSIKAWGGKFKKGDFVEEDLLGIYPGYSLFKIQNPPQNHPEIPVLTLRTKERPQLVRGLRVGTRKFMNVYLPEVEIQGATGKEGVFLKYRSDNQSVYLRKKRGISNCWLIPDDVRLNDKFDLKVENEEYSGYDIANVVTSADNSSKLLDALSSPRRDKFGRTVADNVLHYSQGSNVHGIHPNWYIPYLHLFTPKSEERNKISQTSVFEYVAGNVLLAYLTQKGTSSTEDFYTAFEIIQSAVLKNKTAEERRNDSFLKRTALNFYDYLGYLDYDYETKTIVVNPPQLILIPTEKGRKVLLIGGRDPELVKNIFELSPRYHMSVNAKKQSESNEHFMLPDIVTLSLHGSRSADYGEKAIESLAKELGILFFREQLVSIGLLELCGTIEEYEQDEMENTEVAGQDFNWARRLFDINTLKFKQSTSATFDTSFALIEYKLNEYTYRHRLWKNGRCYKIDKSWGRYLAMKEADRQVILYDQSTKRVAIPSLMPLPRLLAEAIMLLSGRAPVNISYNLNNVTHSYLRYENIPSIFIKNLFKKLKQTVIPSPLVNRL